MVVKHVAVGSQSVGSTCRGGTTPPGEECRFGKGYDRQRFPLIVFALQRNQLNDFEGFRRRNFLSFCLPRTVGGPTRKIGDIDEQPTASLVNRPLFEKYRSLLLNLPVGAAQRTRLESAVGTFGTNGVFPMTRRYHKEDSKFQTQRTPFHF